jgi:hypothetical protein
VFKPRSPACDTILGDSGNFRRDVAGVNRSLGVSICRYLVPGPLLSQLPVYYEVNGSPAQA